MGNERIHPSYYAQTFKDYLINPNSSKNGSYYGIRATQGGRKGNMVDFEAFGAEVKIIFREIDKKCYSDLEIITSEGKKKYNHVLVNVRRSKEGRISGDEYDYSEGWSGFYSKIMRLAGQKSKKSDSK